MNAWHDVLDFVQVKLRCSSSSHTSHDDQTREGETVGPAQKQFWSEARRWYHARCTKDNLAQQAKEKRFGPYKQCQRTVV